MSTGAGLGTKAGAPPAPTSSGPVIGPGPASTSTGATTTQPDANQQLLAALGGLFQQAGQGLGGMLAGQLNQGGQGDQATLPDYLRAPYDAGGQYGSPIQQALSQYMKMRP